MSEERPGYSFKRLASPPFDTTDLAEELNDFVVQALRQLKQPWRAQAERLRAAGVLELRVIYRESAETGRTLQVILDDETTTLVALPSPAPAPLTLDGDDD